MKLKKLTGAAVAESVGVREATVSAWRKGLYRPSGARLESLAVMIGVSADTLLHADDEPQITAWDRLPPAVQAVLEEARYEQERFMVIFAAKLVSAMRNEVAPPSQPFPGFMTPTVDWVTEEELAEDDRVMDQIEAAAEKAKAAKKKGKRASA